MMIKWEWIYQGRSVCDKSFRLLARNQRKRQDDDDDYNCDDAYLNYEHCDDDNDMMILMMINMEGGFINGDQFVKSRSDCSQETRERGMMT